MDKPLAGAWRRRIPDGAEAAMESSWRIELLGGLRAESNGRVLDRFPTRKTAALLAYLAYHCGRDHPRDALVRLLWPESDPTAGRNSLSVALTALRHLLEPDGTSTPRVLVTTRCSVRLDPA